MKAHIFLNFFDGRVLSHSLHEPTVSLHDGIRLFYPIPFQPGRYLFLGDAAQWSQLYMEKRLITGSTYLVCASQTEYPSVPEDLDMAVNIIILDMTISDAIQYLNLKTADIATKESDGREVLISFFREVSVHPIRTAQEMASWKAKFPYPLKMFIACIVVHAEKVTEKKRMSSSDITDILQDFFPDTNLFYYNDEWIIFFSQNEYACEEVNFSYTDFSRLLACYSLNAGISYAGVIPENLYTLYLTAKSSIELGMRINIPPRISRVYSFAQYHTLYLIHLCASEYDRLHNHTSFYYMAHPDVVRIFLYDQEHGTDFLDVLYAYLLNESSLSKSARYLYMHRNTVANKLNKAEALLGYPINQIQDHSIFIVSYMVVKYYCIYQNHKLV